MSHPNDHGYVTPDTYNRNGGPPVLNKPICIRVFLNEDDTQFAVETVDVWGNDAPGAATTATHIAQYAECGECGSPTSSGNKTVYRRWFLSGQQDLAWGNGKVSFYREVAE